MRRLVRLVAVLMIVISGLGILAPDRLVALLSAWPPQARFHAAVGTRLVIAAVFLLGARSCRLPALLYALGILALLAAVMLLFVGGEAVDAFVQWWVGRSPAFIGAWCAVGAVIGACVLYAAGPPRPAHGAS